MMAPTLPTEGILHVSELGDYLRRRREARGLTQAQLAGLANVSQGAICQYELGTITPRAGRLVALARALQLPEEELFALAGYGGPDEATPTDSGAIPAVLPIGGADDRLVHSLARVLADFVRDQLADTPDRIRVAKALEAELLEGPRPAGAAPNPRPEEPEVVEFSSTQALFRALPSSFSEN
jgi:transcriptional regulator with XRE-family HTH domain